MALAKTGAKNRYTPVETRNPKTNPQSTQIANVRRQQTHCIQSGTVMLADVVATMDRILTTANGALLKESMQDRDKQMKRAAVVVVVVVVVVAAVVVVVAVVVAVAVVAVAAVAVVWWRWRRWRWRRSRWWCSL